MTDTSKNINVESKGTDRKTEVVLNSKVADSTGKIIFEDNLLCSQFLRDYINLPYFKDIRPEDIEDVSDQFVPLFAEERNADRVKKISIGKENPFFLISLIEHKSKADYNVSMQIFRYMVYIWEAYAKEAEKIHKGITKLVDFKYPPILPIVYYEGIGKWTVPYDFKSRIIEGESFGQYIPDFKYYLVPLRQYSNEELLARKDEISLVMLINKMRNEDDLEAFRRLSGEEVDEILKESPEHLIGIISNVLRAFLLKMNLPENETEELVGKVKDKKMGYLFEDMTLDIQQIRREAEEQKREAEEQKREAAEQTREAEEQTREAEEMREIAIELVVEAYRKMKISKDVVLKKIQDKFNMDDKEARQKVEDYWK